MSWRDREYNQSRYGGGANSLLSIFTGSVSIGTLFGIRIRIHAMFFWFVGFLILSGPLEFAMSWRLISAAALFVIVLLHEFGHCFAARAVGGHADEIVMAPWGGLALAQPPRRWGATFITVAGGPMVNVIICALMVGVLYATSRIIPPLNPFAPVLLIAHPLSKLAIYAWWIFYISYYLLLFNLLPIFPLDGGQLVQSLLWRSVGQYRSMMIACNTGLIGSFILGIFGIVHGPLMILWIAIMGAFTCWQQKQITREMGPHSGIEEDYSSSLRINEDPPRRRRLSRRSIKQAQKRAAEEQVEQARIDAILEKVSAQGMQSLTWWERRTLRKATERQRQRDFELSRMND